MYLNKISFEKEYFIHGVFKKKKITESTIQISDITGAYSYLVEGSEKAVLIDTGAGAGNLKVMWRH